ncbi:MAG: hypothetical protein LBH01_01990 [Verrucomicrobiales bacterium]|jgi:hypothetical protein|nr:hypothetical protein [Verrucomicrobiales bacterium]
MNRPQESIVGVALTQLGVHETSNNQGPGIEKYWSATTYPEGYADRAPWCAAYGCWVLRKAMFKNPLLALTEDNRPKSASVQEWLSWARKPDTPARLIYYPDGAYGGDTPLPGDVLVLFPVVSHLAIVSGFTVSGQMLSTIEGNTNDDGSREGRECMKRQRRLDPRFGIIRIAARAI